MRRCRFGSRFKVEDSKFLKFGRGTGKISRERIKAINTIFRLNETKKYFDNIKFKKIVLDLWYLDSLEEAESNFFIILKYPLIFGIEFKNNFKKWMYLLKHYLKFNL